MTIGSNERVSGEGSAEPARPCPGPTIVAFKRVRGYPRLPREASAGRSRPRSSLEGRDAVPLTTEITVSQLSPLVGLADAPTIVDVRIDDDHRADPRLLPASLRRDYRTAGTWGSAYAGKGVMAQPAQPQPKGPR